MHLFGCSVTLDPTVRIENDTQEVSSVLAECTQFRSATSEYLLCPGLLAWHAAQHDCGLREAELASIEGEAENELVAEAARSFGTNVWLGGHRDDDFVWRWATGAAFWGGAVGGQAGTGSYARWAPGEPNDQSTVSTSQERCLALTLGGDDWNDRACELQLPYVCERRLSVPPPSNAEDDDEPQDSGDAGRGAGGAADAGASPRDGGADPVTTGTLVLLNTTPAADDTGIATDTDIELVFDRDIIPLTGSFALLRMLDDSTFESVDVSSSAVVADGAALTVDLDGILAGNTTYGITLEAGALEGTDGRAFEGITIEDAINFTTGAAVAPGDVSDGLVLWLDASFPASLKTTGGAVSVWADRSGNNSSVRQPAAERAPALVESAINSTAAVRFDGSSDVLEGPVLDAMVNYDVFVVWQSPVEPPTGQQTHLLRSGPALEVNYGHDRDPFRHAGASQFSTNWRSAQFEPPALDTPYAWNLSFNSTAGTLTAFTNGAVSETTSDLAGSPAANSEPLTVGSRWDLPRYFDGDIGELILYRRVLVATERTAVQGYLDEKWGL